MWWPEFSVPCAPHLSLSLALVPQLLLVYIQFCNAKVQTKALSLLILIGYQPCLWWESLLELQKSARAPALPGLLSDPEPAAGSRNVQPGLPQVTCAGLEK